MNQNMNNQLILILDFGGQYKELIAGCVRRFSVYSEIRSGSMTAEEIKRLNPIGIILTGGPNSVFLPDSPKCDPKLFTLGIPILGICYGMHLMCHMLGGEVASGGVGEYGRVEVTPDFRGNTKPPFKALMSHRDSVTRLPDGFTATARTDSCTAAFENAARKLYGVQYHPESKSTDGGADIIRQFVYDICGASGDYKLDDYAERQIKQIRERVGNEKVLLGLSGGVDSSVCASLLSKAIGERLICIFVDHGFMRLNEGDEIEKVFTGGGGHNLRFIRVNAQKRFLDKIKNISSPEDKRKLIGEEFVRVFEEESRKHGDAAYLAQGTIYPDVVESGGAIGDTTKTATIKSHHNVGGIPDNLSFKGVIEPLSGLFKDEVRVLGKKLGLPSFLVNRQPFPGPGLAIRVMGDVTEEKLNIVRKADAILREEFDGIKKERRPDQYFTVMTDTRTVGVKGDDRTYDHVIAVRAVTTGDFMTCEYSTVPHSVLSRVSSRITSEIPEVSRVVYDITSKPPATVEWE